MRVGPLSDHAAALEGWGICVRRRSKVLPQQLTTLHGKWPMKTPQKPPHPPVPLTTPSTGDLK